MALDFLKNKKILFLSVQTFDYEKHISNKLKSLGAIVDYYDERPANSLFAKGIIRLWRFLYQIKINAYYKNILKKSFWKNYDILFVIKGEVIPAFFLKEFKIRNPHCEFIFYTWDSFRNNPHSISILKYFDRKYTFDINDSKEYNISHRPLFYIDEYKSITCSDTVSKQYDLLFLGTAHSDRYRISNDVINWCKRNNLNAYTYYFIHSKLVFFFKLCFDKSFKKIKYKDLQYKPLNINQIIAFYKQSNVILDINHPDQNGLTMRTFEALGASKKLITTNSNIKKYNFYNENNIYVINRDSLNIKKEFFESSFSSINPQLYYAMSIEGWIKEIFENYRNIQWIKTE